MPRQQSIGEDAAGGKDPLTAPTRLQSVRDAMAEAAISSIDDAATDVSSVTLSVALGQRESIVSNKNGKDDDAEEKPGHTGNMVAPPSPSNNNSRSQLQESFSSIQESLDRGRKGRNSRGKPRSSLLSSSSSDTVPGAVAVPGMGGSQEVRDSKRRSEGANDTSKQLSLAPPIEELSTEAMEAAPLSRPEPSTVVDITPADSEIPPPTRGQTNASTVDATEDTDSSLPIVAELVPDEDKLGDLVQRKVEERLEQEVQNRLANERQSQVTVSAIPVEEEESSAPCKTVPAESENKYIMGMSKSIFWSLVAVLLILIGAGVGVGIALSGGGRGRDDIDDGDNGGTNPESGGGIEPTVAPQSPEDAVPSPNMPTEVIELFDLIGDDVSENKSTLLQEGTPQNQALTWLALEDGWKDEWDAIPKEVAVERYSLAVLYFATGGENWLEQFSFLTSTSVCDWWNDAFGGGVMCDGQGLYVTELHMPSAGLQGTIPTEIGLLSNLERLTMDDNSLVGSLPTELSRLTNILTLSLVSNILSGCVPTQLNNLTKMEVFAILDNQIEGSIPSEIGLLTSLYALDLAYNRLTGSIPPELGSLISLEFLYLDENELDGSLPIELVSLSNLVIFSALGNRLSGEVPSEFASFMQLEVFSIEQNDFHGSLDPVFCLDRSNPPIEDFVADCGGDLPKIECSCCTDCCENGQCRPKLTLGYDILVGRIGDLVTDDLGVFEDTANPQYQAMAWLATEGSWDWTDTSETELLTDQFLIDRYALGTLYFSTNGPDLWQVALPPPSSICDWYPNADSSIQCNINQSVTHLELNEFGLQGMLPSELGLMTTLVSLRLSDNELDSTIPEEYYNLANLELFSIENSLLHGTLSPRIGELSKLTFFSVNTNSMYGTLPTEIGLLTDMTHFLPLRNQFVGSIPLEIQNLVRLEVLDLEGNQLTGALPSEIGLLTNIWGLYFEANNFVSTIPAEYANLRSLVFFMAHDNANLFGTIPSFFGNMPQMVRLFLSDNNLSGTIPTEFGRMRFLELLHLSGNILNGTVPTELGQLPELVELTLFDNFLTGTVPTELAALSSLELVQLQQNELVGNVDPIFCQENRTMPIEVLLADCFDVSPEITCTCCTSC